MSTTDDVLISNILTNDGSPTTVPIYPITVAGNVLGFEATVVAIDANGNCAAWAFLGLVKNVSGNPAIVGNPTSILHPCDVGAVAWTVVIGVDANNLNATLTGAGGVNINWTVRSRVTLAP